MEFQKAIDLNPDYATVHHWYTLYLMYKARFSDAIAEIRKALSLDPLSLAINRDFGTILYYSGRYDEAVDALQKTVELDPNFSLVHELLGRVYLEKEMPDAALVEFQQEKNTSLNWRPILDAWIGIAYMKMGRNENAEDLLRNLLKKSSSAYISPYSLSLMCFSLGNEERGFQWLEKAWQMRDSWLCEINVEPAFKNVRLNPQFVNILTRLGVAN
jgi:tetratricopeptide (TPR) repeat protein